MIDLATLAKFCGTDDTREELRTPWSDAAHSYATCGRLLVQVDRLPEVPVRGIGLDLSRCGPWDHCDITAWEAVPELPPAEFEECEECDGRGQFDLGNPVSNPGFRCEDCGGSGKVELFDSHLDLGTRRLQVGYLRRLKELLPGLLIAPTVGGEMEAMAFKFDGGIGYLMPMRKPGRID